MNNTNLKRLAIAMAACMTALLMLASCGGNTDSSSESKTPSSVNSEGVTVDESGNVSVPDELADVPNE